MKSLALLLGFVVFDVGLSLFVPHHPGESFWVRPIAAAIVNVGLFLVIKAVIWDHYDRDD